MNEEELEDLLGLACCTYHKEIGRKANEYIKNMQKELQLKDKVIEEMAENIIEGETYIASNVGVYTEFDKATKEYVINSYINKVKGE